MDKAEVRPVAGARIGSLPDSARDSPSWKSSPLRRCPSHRMRRHFPGKVFAKKPRPEYRPRFTGESALAAPTSYLAPALAGGGRPPGRSSLAAGQIHAHLWAPPPCTRLAAVVSHLASAAESKRSPLVQGWLSRSTRSIMAGNSASLYVTTAVSLRSATPFRNCAWPSASPSSVSLVPHSAVAAATRTKLPVGRPSTSGQGQGLTTADEGHLW
jgi:hypothetical protein